MSENGVCEHFPAADYENRGRHSSREKGFRSDRCSPTHSAHASLLRHSIQKLSEGKRARKVRFYRNGDRFYKGMMFAISTERFRTFESLLGELTKSPLCDRTVLPNGVRFLFSEDGRKVTRLDQLQENGSYVCASTDNFRRINYAKSSNPSWNVNVKARDIPSEVLAPIQGDPSYFSGENKGFVRPKLVTVIRNGTKPRKAVRVLLNKKTAHSFGQVINDVTEAIKLDTGAVRKIFTLDGKQVTCLADFFKDDSVFIAYGPEKYSLDDFDLDDNEVKYVGGSRTVCKSPRSAQWSAQSPRAVRKLSASSRSLHEVGIESIRGGSPKLTRKLWSPASEKFHMRNGTGDFDETVDNPHMRLLSKYEIGRIIGEGNFAVVKECKARKTGLEYALKIIDKTKCKGREQMIENEVSILRCVKHPNIVLLMEEFDTANELYLVMELVKGGDLFDAIASATKYTERDASGMIYNLMSALKYLHTAQIVHRDVKPENLLVCEHRDGSKSLKLGDFGLATEAEETLYTVCGTPTYVAPEILAEAGYRLKVDVWAAGIITYILLCGFPPFVSQNNNQDELFDKIMSGTFEFTSPFWDDVSDSAKELIVEMLQVNPDDRFSAEDALSHPWVADDTAKDDDLGSHIAKELNAHFIRKSKPVPEAAGIALIASTALDKASRYFQGRGAQLSLQPHENGIDEVF